MAAVVTTDPTTQQTNGFVAVTGTGGSSAKNRVKLDGTVVWAGCSDTTFDTSIQVGSSVATQTVDWEQYIAGTWTSVDTTTVSVVSNSGGGSVTAFPGSGPSTATALKAMMENTANEIIEIAAGTYTGFHVYIRNTRGASNPLTVRPAPGAAVIFDNTGGGTGQNGLFYFGAESGLPGLPTSVTDYITIDAAGTGGSFAVTNYSIGSTGLVYLGWSDHITVNGFTVTGFDGVDNGSGQYNQSHAVYVSAGNSHATTNLTANSWNVTGTSRHVNGVQTFHEPQGATRTFNTWTVTQLHRWALIYGNTGSANTINGWNGTNCDATIDSPTGQAVSGTVLNCNGHGSCGTLALGSGVWTNTNVTNGGGNSA